MTTRPSCLPGIEIEPVAPADAAIIWLHGLGASGHDFEPIVPELKLPTHLGIRFIFPHAPSISVTINGGMVMPAWYDILSMEFGREVDEQQIFQSAAAVTRLIDREQERGIDSRRIIVAGFSQGGAVALQAALTYAEPLAGLMGLSAGRLEKGAPADLVLFDPDEGWKVDADKLLGKAQNSPFDGRPVQGRVLRTVIDGRPVFEPET